MKTRVVGGERLITHHRALGSAHLNRYGGIYIQIIIINSIEDVVKLKLIRLHHPNKMTFSIWLEIGGHGASYYKKKESNLIIVDSLRV